MKLLIQQVFATKRPLYLLPNYFHYIVRSGKRVHSLVKGVGVVKKNLFAPGAYDGIELDVVSLGVIRSRDWQIDTGRMKKILAQNVPIESVHAAFLPEQLAKIGRMKNGLNPAFRSDHVVAGIKAQIQLASLLPCEDPILVLHPGMVPQSLTTASAIDCIVENIKECLPELEKTRVILGLENLGTVPVPGKPRAVGGHYNELLEMVTRINHPQVKVVYDWGHANCFARWIFDHDSNLAPEYLSNFTFHHEFISALKDNICYLHLNFNPAHLTGRESRKGRFQGWDFHQGLDRADPKSLEGYKKIMQRIYTETTWRKFGAKALLELSPLGITRFFRMGYMGSSDRGAMITAKILRDWWREFETKHD